jgi:hypothetical protein
MLEEVRNLLRMWSILKVFKLSIHPALARKFLSVTNTLAYSAAGSMTAKFFNIIEPTVSLEKMFFNTYIRILLDKSDVCGKRLGTY